jgi:hypothetical protein
MARNRPALPRATPWAIVLRRVAARNARRTGEISTGRGCERGDSPARPLNTRNAPRRAAWLARPRSGRRSDAPRRQRELAADPSPRAARRIPLRALIGPPLRSLRANRPWFAVATSCGGAWCHWHLASAVAFDHCQPNRVATQQRINLLGSRLLHPQGQSARHCNSQGHRPWFASVGSAEKHTCRKIAIRIALRQTDGATVRSLT